MLTHCNRGVVVRFDYVWVDNMVDHFSAYSDKAKGH